MTEPAARAIRRAREDYSAARPVRWLTNPEPARGSPGDDGTVRPGDGSESCEIRYHDRSIRAHFFAVPCEGGPVIARSPYFKTRKGDAEPGVDAADALGALVDELSTAGWRQTASGAAPWDLRFSRPTAPKSNTPRRRAARPEPHSTARDSHPGG
jgi:hypothetical protein